VSSREQSLMDFGNGGGNVVQIVLAVFRTNGERRSKLNEIRPVATPTPRPEPQREMSFGLSFLGIFPHKNLQLIMFLQKLPSSCSGFVPLAPLGPVAPTFRPGVGPKPALA
jgi:hypothetical protein